MTADTSGPQAPSTHDHSDCAGQGVAEDGRVGADVRAHDGSDARPRKVGLFGGTFDPIHHGHLAAAWNVRQLLDLDEVWLVVANDPWQKSGDRRITPAATRLGWVRHAVEGFDGIEASAVEIEAGGASYTFDTITTLRARHPDVTWSVIVGTDVVADLDTWHRAADLRDAIEIVAVQRPGSVERPVPDRWTVRHVDIPPLDLSSTQLRELASAGRLLHFLVPSMVADEIAASGVYLSAPSGESVADPT